MSNKNKADISIKQLMEVSLLSIIILFTGIRLQKIEENIDVEDFNVVEKQYEESIVENNEDDYIHYEQIKYLDKKEITNVVSRGSNVDRKNKEEEKIEIQEEIISANTEENLVHKEEVINNREESNIQTEKNNSATEPPTEYKEVLEAKATAYCLCKKCCGKSETHPEYGVTASGLKIVPGTDMKVIAVDPNIIPLGTKVYVEGLNGAADYGYAIAADTGSAINSLKVDLYMDSHEKAYQWGRKSVKIYVIE